MAKMSTNFTHADLVFANMLHYFDINKLKCFDQGDKQKLVLTLCRKFRPATR